MWHIIWRRGLYARWSRGSCGGESTGTVWDEKRKVKRGSRTDEMRSTGKGARSVDRSGGLC